MVKYMEIDSLDLIKKETQVTLIKCLNATRAQSYTKPQHSLT